MTRAIHTGEHISRRTLLAGFAGAASALAGAALPSPLLAQSPTGAYRFRISRRSGEIGDHAVAFREAGDQLVVTTSVSIAVKVAFITAFRYEHESEETWRDGRLASLISRTNDDGERIDVSGIATNDGFRTVGPAGPYVSPGDLQTSNSMWRQGFVRQSELINAREGGVLGVSARPAGSETISVKGRLLQADKYRAITPQVGGFLWYSPSAEWVRAELEVEGERVIYERI